jgi:alkylation response protein AidB-like acyl-CoA dehydrogenase
VIERFIPSDEQRMLRDSVRRWAEQLDVRKGESIEAAWPHFSEMGWLMAGLPESAGGLGGDTYDTAIIAEELGRSLVRAPYVEVAVTAAQLLLDVAPDRVGSLALGETRPLLAHDELEARGDPAWVRVHAAHERGSWYLSGRKTALLGADHADTLYISAMVEGTGVTLFELPAADATLRAFTTIDDRPCAELWLDRTKAAPLGPIGKALPAIERALDHALIVESAEALGAMQRALELTGEYLLTRRQYGQRIGDFQALRHRLADMFIDLEQARSIVFCGLEALSSQDLEARGLYAAATKARVGQSGLFIAAQAIQLHGGIGLTDEYSIGHYFKRLLAFNQRRGTAEFQVQRFAELSLAAAERSKAPR